MIRRPPRSTPFPTRRSSDLCRKLFAEAASGMLFEFSATQNVVEATAFWGDSHISESAFAPRSEEHTSELQSRLHLVCRLLLEKKKNTDKLYVLATVQSHILC